VAAQVHLVLVGGPPATGKSTLAARLAEQRGWVVLRSDELRKDLAGLAHTARAAAPVGEGLYTEATTRATYTELTRRARRLLELGESVILDASFSAAVHRAAARQAAARAGAWCTELVCRAEPEVVEARLARRAADRNEVSDATVEVAEAIRARFEPWPEATVLDTAAPVDDVIAAASAAIEATAGEAAPRRPASPVGNRAAACGPD
jgi:predicted kinase